jgi:uncharacterized membrane protein YeaQ/YmgE (transglycosylase-associated protein family)
MTGRKRLADAPVPLLCVSDAGVAVSTANGAWIILGLIAGFIGSKIVNKTGQGMILDIVLGIVGAIVGGTLFSLIGMTGVTGLNIWSIIVAVIGSIVVLWLYHKFSRRRAY